MVIEILLPFFYQTLQVASACPFPNLFPHTYLQTMHSLIAFPPEILVADPSQQQQTPGTDHCQNSILTL